MPVTSSCRKFSLQSGQLSLIVLKMSQNFANLSLKPSRRICAVMRSVTARPPSRSTSSPPKHLMPLTPASARKNKNKRARPPAADEHSKQSPSQQREIWVRSPSPTVGSVAGQQRSRERSLSPGAGSPAVAHRSASPAVGSVGQSKGQRSDNAEGSAVFTRRSPSVSNMPRQTTTHPQQTYAIHYAFSLSLLQIY